MPSPRCMARCEPIHTHLPITHPVYHVNPFHLSPLARIRRCPTLNLFPTSFHAGRSGLHRILYTGQHVKHGRRPVRWQILMSCFVPWGEGRVDARLSMTVAVTPGLHWSHIATSPEPPTYVSARMYSKRLRVMCWRARTGRRPGTASKTSRSIVVRVRFRSGRRLLWSGCLAERMGDEAGTFEFRLSMALSMPMSLDLQSRVKHEDTDLFSDFRANLDAIRTITR